MAKFVIYKQYWWELDETSDLDYALLFNHYGGCVSGVDVRNLPTAEAEDFRSLDWSGTPVLDNTSKFGWLDRNGVFYGCSFTDHNNQARLVHHANRRDLEKSGWVHSSKDAVNDPTGKLKAHFYGDYKNGIMPTDAQMMYLIKRNDVDFSIVYNAYENGNLEKARIYEENLQNQAKKDDFEL